MTLLHMQVNKDLSESERECLNTVYDRFINQIQHVSKQENQSKPDSLHVLARIREHLPLSAQILRIIGDLYNAP